MPQRSKSLLGVLLGVLFIGFAVAGFITGNLVVAVVALLIGLADFLIATVFLTQTRQQPRRDVR